ncbi:unnamed protein product [Rotaria sordida]|uniref:Uncharacterized protein n=1 Tax=Rotaria sordida TaxID=392033 RepID=A0A815R769_9BILA|nr:unnamed protein product [Rotaria sordida]CAF1473090.1 unnamed protein product [Rotaria sordida]
MSSIRNISVDVASIRILQYLRTHNYDDCAIYINRLNSNTFRKILNTDLSIDILLAQLPFSIEIFEVIYSKIFIIDPDTFPLQILKPEQLISKMISIFSSAMHENISSIFTSSKFNEQYIDDEHILSNFASILRIISYVRPILFKRLLRQKEIIDECILYFEQRHSNITNISILRKSTSLTHINLKETLCHELESTIICCQQALHKLGTKTITMPRTSSSAYSTPSTPKKHNSIRTSTSVISSIATTSTTNSLDDIQNRLYQHTTILNSIEPYLSHSKLHTIINNLSYKVSIDKQILLAYAHIKTHEKQIPFGEPLLPLFKRFAFAYERIIQLWRRVTDSTLIDECADDIVIDDTTVKGVSNRNEIYFERTLTRKLSSHRTSRIENEFPMYRDDMAVKDGLIGKNIFIKSYDNKLKKKKEKYIFILIS